MFSSLLHSVSNPFLSRGSCYILLKFDGFWSKNFKFICEAVYEIDIPCDSKFKDLLFLIRSTVQSHQEAEYIISYSSDHLQTRSFIRDDYTLNLYMRLKCNFEERCHFPLCVERCHSSDHPNSRLIHTTLNGDSIADQRISHSGDDFSSDLHISPGLPSTSQPDGNVLLLTERSVIDTQSYGWGAQDTHVDPEILSSSCTSGDGSALSLQEAAPLLVLKSITSFDPTMIAVGAVYECKKVLLLHLKRLAIADFFQFRTRRSSGSVLNVVCIDHTRCSWAVRAVRLNKQDQIFQVRRYDHEHQCSVDARQGHSRQATYDVVAKLVKHQFYDASKKPYPPRSIIADMQREHGIHMTYKKAWFAKEKALQLCFGTPEESYASLPALCSMMNKTNPGSFIELSMTSDNLFKYFFISLAAWREGWPHCVPVLVIDGSFMKSYYKGTLFSAVTRDGNNQIFPLAFGFCDAENTENWTWFLTKVRLALDHRPVQYVISDRHEDILSAVKSVFPGVSHGHCIFHIFGNIKHNFHGSEKSLSWKFYGAARAATQAECYRFVQYFDRDDRRIIGYLHGIGFEKWARSFSTNRYSIMTSNLAESMNSVDAIRREYPIAKVVDFLTCRMQRWFHERRELANSTSTILTKHYESKLNALHASSAVMEVRPASTYEFLVFETDGRSFVVNFKERSCSCGEFQLDYFVCVHAVAATRHRPGLSCYDYVSPFFTAAELRAAYTGVVHPMPSKDSWVLDDEVARIVCKPPSCSKRPAGRPKKRRILSKGEHRQRQLCSRCKSPGHNRKTCTNPIRRTAHDV